MKKIVSTLAFLAFSTSAFTQGHNLFYCEKVKDAKDQYKIMADVYDDEARGQHKGLISSDIKLSGKECLDYVMGKNLKKD